MLPWSSSREERNLQDISLHISASPVTCIAQVTIGKVKIEFLPTVGLTASLPVGVTSLYHERSWLQPMGRLLMLGIAIAEPPLAWLVAMPGDKPLT